MTKRVAAFGAWDSPISAESLAAHSVRLGGVELDGEDVYWTERRPAEQGRYVVVRQRQGAREDVLLPPHGARTLVHEYGGRCMTVVDGTLYFSNFDDQGLYRQRPGQPPEPVAQVDGLRFADPVLDARSGQLICVCEDHREAGKEAVNSLVAVALDGSGAITTIAAGADFYSSPVLSPDGQRLAWISWTHPKMPWDSTRLWVAERGEGGQFHGGTAIAGGAEESVLQPRFSPDGVLTFLSDRTGWSNLYRWQDGTARAVCPMAAEVGQPHWGFGNAAYGYVSAEVLVCSYWADGVAHLARIHLQSGTLTPIDTPFSVIRELKVGSDEACFIAASATAEAVLVRLALDGQKVTQVSAPSTRAIDPAHVSVPEAIDFPTGDGEVAHAFFYRPTNASFCGAPGARPPCIVFSHGGPTSATTNEHRSAIQYWTTRGFALVDVNYRGSTGYGRAYRERLYGSWGLLDVEDCVAAAQYLVDRGDVDGERLAIRGGSAGGYTTLMAVTFTDVFKAGASHYGISDVTALVQETHKFESRYIDQLIGPYPEAEATYRARSPLHHADRISCPMLFLQGLEDKAVPPAQAERMVEALKARQIPVAYVAFAGEQHGFRKAENIRRALEAEQYFYCSIFQLPLPPNVLPVQIHRGATDA